MQVCEMSRHSVIKDIPPWPNKPGTQMVNEDEVIWRC